jgi:hypothetical protein
MVLSKVSAMLYIKTTLRMVWPDKATKMVASFIIINCWQLIAPSNTGFALISLHANNYVLPKSIKGCFFHVVTASS